MTMDIHEAHVEQLLGTVVRDVDGEPIGRIEEMIVEIVDGEPAVTELHLGPGALLERLAVGVRSVPFFGWLPAARRYVLPWNVTDWSNPAVPRARVAKTLVQRL